nr:germin-like protein 1-3 [Aegilops tauschii subsp. strangulata]
MAVLPPLDISVTVATVGECLLTTHGSHISLRLNGFPCKRTGRLLLLRGNPVGSAVPAANVEKLPGLNTLGVSMSRVDYAPWGVNPPHTHPSSCSLRPAHPARRRRPAERGARAGGAEE